VLSGCNRALGIHVVHSFLTMPRCLARQRTVSRPTRMLL
jgi:hypothetical protein